MSTPLPYGTAISALLPSVRKGFLVVNRWLAAPMLRVGGGPLLATPIAGSILLLRTTGRKTGLVREAPLDYAIIDGRVVVVAGYGRRAHWFANAVAHPEVEVVLPGAVFAGRAEEITEPTQRRTAFRALVATMGVVGTLTLGDVRAMSDAEVDALAQALPMLAITPTALHSGPFDPGGIATRVNATVWLLIAAAAVTAGLRRGRRP